MLRDALDFALTSLRGNLAKSLLTVLGLGVGVGAVLTVLSLGDAGEIRVEEEIARLGVDKVCSLQSIQCRAPCVGHRVFRHADGGLPRHRRFYGRGCLPWRIDDGRGVARRANRLCANCRI